MELAYSEYWFDPAAAGGTARSRQLARLHTEGRVCKLELEEHSMVAEIDLEVVAIAGTVPEVVVVGVVGVAGIVPEMVVSIAPVVVVAAVSQRLGRDMAPAVKPQQISSVIKNLCTEFNPSSLYPP